MTSKKTEHQIKPKGNASTGFRWTCTCLKWGTRTFDSPFERTLDANVHLIEVGVIEDTPDVLGTYAAAPGIV